MGKTGPGGVLQWLFPGPSQHCGQRFVRLWTCLVAFVGKSLQEVVNSPRSVAPRDFTLSSRPTLSLCQFFKLSQNFPTSLFGSWPRLPQIKINKYLALFLPAGACLSPDFRLDVCPVTSVLSWVQKKLSICFLSQFVS